MFVEAVFKSVFSQSYVICVVFVFVIRNVSSVNDASPQAVTLKRACVFVSTVTFAGLGFVFGVKDLAVMGFHNGSHVGHTAVANFDIVAVENFAKLVVIREVVVEEG